MLSQNNMTCLASKSILTVKYDPLLYPEVGVEGVYPNAEFNDACVAFPLGETIGKGGHRCFLSHNLFQKVMQTIWPRDDVLSVLLG